MTNYSLVTQLASFLFPLNQWNNPLHARVQQFELQLTPLIQNNEIKR